jgi:hypothetical protein
MRCSVKRACALMGLVCACDADLPVYSQVEGLRVLAVAAEPPQVPAGQPATLSALVASPGATTYQWRWCPAPTEAADGHACPWSGPLPPGAPPLTLGEAEVARLPGLSQAALLELCAALGQPGCEALEAEVALTVTAAGETVEARKTLRLLTGAAPAPENPALLGVEATQAGLQTRLSTAAATPLTGPAADLTVMADGDPSALTATWFVDGGELDFSRTRPEPMGPENTWTLPTVDGPARLFVVLRDADGGTAWRTYPVQVVAP